MDAIVLPGIERTTGSADQPERRRYRSGFQDLAVNHRASSSNRIGHPLKFNDLVSIVFQLRRIRELIFVSDSPDTGSPGVELADSSETPDQRIEWREFLTRVWGEIETLPRYQRSHTCLISYPRTAETEVFRTWSGWYQWEIGKTLQLN
ncbi:MAG: hypothetical protein IPM55_22960 [Acidobacteria bacterium]|nr:hypothetical protein [Acidobacteriota bacterium]